ncbi:MAG: hypothetical protein QW532_00130 [Archaeoglobaceae archaeon]
MIEELVREVEKRVPVKNREDVEKKLKILVTEFKVPAEEAVRSVVNSIRKELGIVDAFKDVKIAEIREGESVNLKFKVLKLFEGRSEKIECTMLVGDETGIARAVVLKGATEIKFETGKCYAVKRALIRNGIMITKVSSVSEIGEKIAVKPITFTGAIVSVGKLSGFVARCPECGAAISTICKKHGKVKPVIRYEARIVVDNGEKAISVPVSENDLEKISGLSRKEAQEIRMEYSSNEPVLMELTGRLIGKYVKVEMGETIRVEVV